MSLQTYNPTGIVHETSVDIGNTRALPVTIKLTQGDKTLPVIAVHLLNNGQRYQMPQSVQSATLNVLKADRHAVSLNAEGTNNNRDTLYFVVTEQTCAAAGKATANVQIQESASSVAGTGTFYIRIDPDPTYEADFNDSAASDLEQLVQKAQAAAEKAEESATEAQQALADVQEAGETAVDNINTAKTEAISSIKGAVQAAQVAAGKAEEEADRASSSATQANASATNADTSAQEAQEAAEEAGAHADRAASEATKAQEAAKKVDSLSTSISAMFAAQRTGKVYSVNLPIFANNQSSTGEKTRDNSGLVCEPSTDTDEGQDDYAEIPLFKWYNCNYVREDDSFAKVTALEGMPDYKTEGAVDVGVIYPMMYYKRSIVGDHVETIVSDSPHPELGLKPFEAGVRQDGTVMPYFILSKYYCGIASDGKLRSQPNLVPKRAQSYQNMIANFGQKGTGYHGQTSHRETYAIIMQEIKYATKSSQTIAMGCTQYNLQYAAAVKYAEEHTYFPVTASQAANFVVGSRVSVGYAGADNNIDRGVSSMHAYADEALITKIEDLGDGNKAVYIDCNPFSTADVNGAKVYISTMHWHAGTTDSVIGHHDGSMGSNTNAKYPWRIQGLEFNVGGYSVNSDVVMNFMPDYSKDVYQCKPWDIRKTALADIQELYTKIGNVPANSNGTGADLWIGDIEVVNGTSFPSTQGNGSATGVGDIIYAGGTSTSGLREYLRCGHLWSGSHAGLSFLFCWASLSHAYWYFVAAD